MNQSSEDPPFQNVEIAAKTPIAEGIWALELVSPDGSLLAPFTAGAHVAVHTPSGATRHYSLANDPCETERYLLAIKAETGGRGGSVSLTNEVSVGDQLDVSLPKNNFPLVEAPEYILIAGGIGITPILSMARQLARQNKPFRLIYCTRSPATTAFLDDLTKAEFQAQVTLHHDEGDSTQAYDFWSLLGAPTKAHVYCCGPGPLMEEVRGVTGHWPADSIHFEDFGSDIEVLKADDHSFSVIRESTGQTFQVAADETILDALRAAGEDLRSSCESGTCGTCKVKLIDGEPDHRDIVLADEEQREHMMICVSRARGDRLVLDWP